MSKKEIFAKMVRVVTVPPALVSILIVILASACNNVVTNWVEAVTSIFLLGILPVLAYPMQEHIPQYRSAGRLGQRKLAFLFTLAGYTCALIFGLFFHVNKDLLLVYLTYFLSVMLLTICNAVLHVHASGHMCSITGPMSLLIYFVNWWALLPCILILILVAWASVNLKRHTEREVVIGGCIGIIGFAISFMLI